MLPLQRGNYQAAINTVQQQISANNAGAVKYQNTANSVYNKYMSTKNGKKGKNALSSSEKKQLRSAYSTLKAGGKIDISRYGEKVQTAIKDVQTWYDKSVDCRYAVQDLNSTLLDYQEALANLPLEEASQKIEKLNRGLKGLEAISSRLSAASKGGSVQAQLNSFMGTDEELASATSAKNSAQSAYNSASADFSAKSSSLSSAKSKTASAKKSYDSAMDTYEKYMAKAKEAKKKGKTSTYKKYKKKADAALKKAKVKKAAYNSALRVQNSAQSAYNTSLSNKNSAQSKLDVANSDLYEAQQESSLRDQYKDKSELEYMNALVDEEVSLKRQQNKVYEDAYSKTVDAYTKSKTDVNLKAMEEAAEQMATSQAELAEAIVEAEQTKFENVKTYYEGQIDYYNELNDVVQQNLDLQEAQGKYIASASYDDLIENTKKQKALQEEMVKGLQEQMAKSITSGIIKENTMEWLEMQTQIEEAKNSLSDFDIAIEELKDKQLEVYYEEVFDRAIEKADKYIEKLKTINDLLTDEMMYDYDTGRLTELGALSLTLNSSELQTQLNNLKDYVKKRQDIINKYNQNEIGEAEYDEMVSDVESDIQDALSNANSIRGAILDIIENTGESQLNALKKSMDAWSDALSKKKDYYDYDKELKDQTKSIQLLEQQIAALDGVSDAEARAKKARLEAELEESREGLNETVKDHVYELQISGIDELSNKLEEDFEKYIYEISSNLEKMTEAIDNAVNNSALNATDALNAIGSILSQFGIKPSDIGIDKIPGFATGTNYVPKSGLYRVGENGREILVTKDGIRLTHLERGEGVINNHNTEAIIRNMTNGFLPSVNFDIPELDLSNNIVPMPNNINPVIECPITIMGNANEADVIRAINKSIPKISKQVQTDIRMDLKKSGMR